MPILSFILTGDNTPCWSMELETETPLGLGLLYKIFSLISITHKKHDWMANRNNCNYNQVDVTNLFSSAATLS